ncbi:MAG: glycoside hydrolase, partial [Halobacteriales archaeon]|nr:glycoside hydrolase [Halobacteriales archaeon]
VPILALTLAGCISQSAPIAPSMLPSVEVPRLRFAPEVALPQDGFGAEPSVAVLPDGTVFVVSTSFGEDRPNMVQGAGWLWRSKDTGATWDKLRGPEHSGRPGLSFCSCDSDVATSPDGWVYYSDGWVDGQYVGAGGLGYYASAGSYLVERSSDGGSTWTSAPVTTLDGTTGIDRQWLLAGADGFLMLAYSWQRAPVYATGLGGDATSDVVPRGNALRAVLSADHGATWSAPVDVVAAETGHFHFIGHPRRMPDGGMVLPYADHAFPGNASSVALAVSRDGGKTWRSLPVAPEPDGIKTFWPVQGDVDAAGHIVLAWSAVHAGNHTLRAAESGDGGATWVPILEPMNGTQLFPWVAARDGEVAIAWYGSEATGEPMDAPGPSAWRGVVALRRAPGEPFVLGPMRDTPLKEGPLCPYGGSCPKDRELLDFPGLAYLPDGALLAAFAFSEPGDGQPRGHVAVARLLG